MADLQGKVVAFLEGRRAAEMASLIARHNGVPLAAPCLREVHTPDAPELQQSIARVCDAARLDVAIFLTGVGTRTVFESATLMGREADLRRRLDEAQVAVRGPKPTAALRQLGVRIDITAPPPNTTAELLGELAPVDLHGKTVSVQLYGAPNPDLSQALRARGAQVIELAPYVWERPIDPAPVVALLDALEAGQVDVLLITSQIQVDHLFGIGRERGREPVLASVLIGAQGPVAAAALERHGQHAHFRPEHGHMGALVLAAARHVATDCQSERSEESHRLTLPLGRANVRQ
jgi:uroporphyrinogen-III synthase